MKYPKRFLIHTNHSLPIRWNGRDPILDTHSTLRTLKPFEESIRAWVSGARGTDTPPLVLLGGRIRLEALSWANPLDPGSIPRSLSFLIPKGSTPESQALKGPLMASLLWLMGLMGIWFLAIMLRQPDSPPPGAKPLIPERYAKILLAPANRTGEGSRIRATRSYSSRTVQNSIRSLLKNRIPSPLPVSVGLSSLTRSDSLSRLAGSPSSAPQAGSTRIGATAGYARGTGPLIEGQGSGLPGKGFVGLDTREALIDEGLTREEVARVIHSHMNEIRYCYETAILRDPTLAGKLLVDFKINQEGRVPMAGVSEATLRDEGVARCLLGKLRAWKFPEPRGGAQVAVSYPFLFKSLTR